MEVSNLSEITFSAKPDHKTLFVRYGDDWTPIRSSDSRVQLDFIPTSVPGFLLDRLPPELRSKLSEDVLQESRISLLRTDHYLSILDTTWKIGFDLSLGCMRLDARCNHELRDYLSRRLESIDGPPLRLSSWVTRGIATGLLDLDLQTCFHQTDMPSKSVAPIPAADFYQQTRQGISLNKLFSRIQRFRSEFVGPDWRRSTGTCVINAHCSRQNTYEMYIELTITWTLTDSRSVRALFKHYVRGNSQGSHLFTVNSIAPDEAQLYWGKEPVKSLHHRANSVAVGCRDHICDCSYGYMRDPEPKRLEDLGPEEEVWEGLGHFGICDPFSWEDCDCFGYGIPEPGPADLAPGHGQIVLRAGQYLD